MIHQIGEFISSRLADSLANDFIKSGSQRALHEHVQLARFYRLRIL